MARKVGPERMLSDAERAVLRQLPNHAVADFAAILSAVQPAEDGKWTWRHGTLHASQDYDTFTAAADAFEAYIAQLMESERVEREQRYGVEQSD